MKFENLKVKNFNVIKVFGRMDASNASLFEEEVKKLLQDGNKYLIADLENLEYISSAGLRSILSAGKLIKAENGSLRLSSLNGIVLEVFEISGFDAIFQIFESIEEAVEQS
ncbi:MAG: STAS domain-containing protein [Desulfobacteraceae bacterium]|nr:STAS domain-containing protein [Desulfobacteraceae bacterium]